jgi:PPOX class probable F420-dependent enzyme
MAGDGSVSDELEFVRPQRHAVMITHRKGGGLQTSVVTAVAGRDGQVWVWSRGSTAKIGNLRRDPRATLCVVDDDWHTWTHVDVTIEIVPQPQALPLLDDYYRLRHGREHPNWDDYRRQMLAEARVLFRATPTRVFHPPRD